MLMPYHMCIHIGPSCHAHYVHFHQKPKNLPSDSYPFIILIPDSLKSMCDNKAIYTMGDLALNKYM